MGSRSSARSMITRVPGVVAPRPWMSSLIRRPSSCVDTLTSTLAWHSAATTLTAVPPETKPTFTDMPLSASVRACRVWVSTAISWIALAPCSISTPECAARPSHAPTRRLDEPLETERRLEHEDTARFLGQALDMLLRFQTADLLIGVQEDRGGDAGLNPELRQGFEGEHNLDEASLHVEDSRPPDDVVLLVPRDGHVRQRIDRPDRVRVSDQELNRRGPGRAAPAIGSQIEMAPRSQAGEDPG